MSTIDENKTLPVTDAKDCLRVILDAKASASYAAMVAKLKATGKQTKFHPSMLVSFLVTDFFETYFEKDIDVLVARFFDSKAFMAAQIQKAKSPTEASEILKMVTDTIEQVNSLSRTNRRSKQGTRKSGDKKILSEK